MPSRSLRAAALALLLVALSACQMTVQVGTKLDGKGGGTFRLAMTLDRELRNQLESADGAGAAASGLIRLDTLFDSLRAKGWTTQRSEPDGGLFLSASRSFVDSAGFDRTLSELGSARSGGAIGNVALKLDYTTKRSLLKTTSRFSGHIDTTGAGTLDADTRAILKQLASVVHFEIRANLPGSVSDVTGVGSLTGGQVVWRPDLGSAMTFGATSSALRIGTLMLILVPLLLLGGGLAWFLLGRREAARRSGEPPSVFIPDPVEPDEVVAAPEPVQTPEPAQASEVLSNPG